MISIPIRNTSLYTDAYPSKNVSLFLSFLSLSRCNVLRLRFPIASIIASKCSAARKRALQSLIRFPSSVNYIHVKRIASARAYILSLRTFIAVAITLEPLDIPARIATILYFDCLYLFFSAPLSYHLSFAFSLIPSLSLPSVSQCRFRLTYARCLPFRFSNPATKRLERDREPPGARARIISNRYTRARRPFDRRKSTSE